MCLLHCFARWVPSWSRIWTSMLAESVYTSFRLSRPSSWQEMLAKLSWFELNKRWWPRVRAGRPCKWYKKRVCLKWELESVRTSCCHGVTDGILLKVGVKSERGRGVLDCNYGGCLWTGVLSFLHSLLLLLFLLLILFETDFLCCFGGCPGTHSVDQVGLELTEIHPSLTP